jgi:hypothetical protein
MEHIISDPHGRRTLLGTAALLLTITMSSAALPAQAAPGPIAVGTDGVAYFEVTPEAGATEVWIEVEDPSINAADVVVRLGGANQLVTDTALGAIAVVAASAGTQSFAVALTTEATPDIAVTIIDGTGTVLSSRSYQLALEDYRPLVPSATTPDGYLAATGVTFGLYLVLTMIGVVAVLVGIAISARRRERAAQ